MKSINTLKFPIVVVLLSLLRPGLTSAHPMKGVGAFYAGMLHPITTLEFLLPIIALSLMAGQQGRTTSIGVLVTFPTALALGTCLALPGSVPAVLAWINVGSIVVLGILVAIAQPLPLPLSLGSSALVGATIGVANAAEFAGRPGFWRFATGLAALGLMLVTYGIGCVRRFRAPWMRIGFRVVGSWIAAVGILVLGLK